MTLNKPPEISLSVDQLATLLFEKFVLEDEEVVINKDLGRYLIDSTSQTSIFKKYVFFYLVGLVAVAPVFFSDSDLKLKV